MGTESRLFTPVDKWNTLAHPLGKWGFSNPPSNRNSPRNEYAITAMTKNRMHMTIVLGLAVALAMPLTAAEWRIDTNHSAAQFAVKHMMVSTVRGAFEKMTGTVNYDPAAPENASVKVEIDVSTVNTRNAKRDGHLKSPDFFDVAKYPTMTFESTKVQKAGSGLKLTGNLTLHGVTKEVTFDVDGPAEPVKSRGGLRTGATATAKISRKDFGLTWNRMLEAGGVTVGDEVDLIIDIEMTQGGAPGGRRGPRR